MMSRSEVDAALNRVTKWRSLLAGWQLGTRLKGDPESDAVRDHREATILLRVEGSALVGLLIEKGVFTAEEWTDAVGREAVLLNANFEERFPGVTAHDYGLSFDGAQAEDIAKWMRGWKP
jgi:hypothetical protein